MPEVIEKVHLRQKLLEEINLLSDDNLSELYYLIHHFRLGLEKQNHVTRVMALAGAWKDMPDDEFDDFLNEIYERRRKNGRRDRHEAILD